jgi:meiotically up-regulated gene 157 (Mug157) protein
MQRKQFLKSSALIGTGILMNPSFTFSLQGQNFPVVRIPEAERKFKSAAIESAIKEIKSNIGNKEIAWLFENCYPNTLDTTVDFEMKDGRPDTYVITGDIDAMWLRDSTAQVTPYLSLAKDDPALHEMIAGVINRQVYFILKDPYANAFYKDETRVSEWKNDLTDMKPGIHERKWEIDSLCYPIRLSYQYWKITGDTTAFDDQWKKAITLIVKTFKEQQRKDGPGPYKFQRETAWATDGVAMGGYGYPVKPVGLICSVFRPSDDVTLFNFLVPSNFFAVVSLRHAAEIIKSVYKDSVLGKECLDLANKVESALRKHAITTHPQFGKVYAFETNGFGSYNLMDDANIPSLLSLPYLGGVKQTDPIYLNTRKFILSKENPFFFKGKAGEGIGGPHIGLDMIWPMAIVMRGLTSNNDAEIKDCIKLLQHCHGGTGFMHESFHKDDATNFTRSWFAWSNTIFGEFIWKVYKERPHLLKG